MTNFTTERSYLDHEFENYVMELLRHIENIGKFDVMGVLNYLPTGTIVDESTYDVPGGSPERKCQDVVYKIENTFCSPVYVRAYTSYTESQKSPWRWSFERVWPVETTKVNYVTRTQGK